jgi:uncharacterized protein YndB with AHSA1/START domain
VRQQVFIDAPVEAVWELVADVERHPMWWPRVIEVECEGLEEGCNYRQVTKTPVGVDVMNMHVERLEDCRDLSIRCLNTGTYVRMLLTEAQGGTFVDGSMGMDPQRLPMRVFDVVAGKRYFTRWLEQSLDAMKQAAAKRAADRSASR